jgi:predicted Zn finger-like uncharacterized protein
MLITTCGNCRARFRVTPQQLNAKQGQVRCGRCRQVFNGFESLERFPDDDTGARLLAAREAEERTGREVISEVETLQVEGGSAVPDVAAESAPMRSVDFEPTQAQAAAPVEPPGPPSTPLSARARRRELELTLEQPPREPPARAWRFAVVLMLVVLLVETGFAFRGALAQRYPVLRPPLEAACGWLACTVPYAREHGLLKLEESELLEVPGRPNEIALGARVRNLASYAQEYPYVELTLTDLSGQAAVRRVLRPTDYLGRPIAPGEVLAPGAELAIQIRLELLRVRATGYQLLLFYP